MANKYSKALKHLKNKNIDEKLKLLEQIPTNNTTGLYVDTPGTFKPEEIGPGDLPPNEGLNLAEDGDGAEGYTGNDTTGLFLADGTIKSIEPPGDTSYILGPMMSMWYAWANYTQIGYVRQSDRKMVNLGRIAGEMSAWDGETGFTGYGQMSIEQVVWFKEQTRADYRAFYPGPPSNPADEYGRYIGSMISSSKSTQTVTPQVSIPGINRSSNATDDLSLLLKNKDKDRADEISRMALNALMLGLDIAAVVALLFPEPASSVAGAAHLATKLRYVAKLARALSRRNPFKSSPKPKITYRYKPTKAKYGDSPKSKPTPEQPKYNPKEPGGGKEYQAAARNFQRQNPGKYNPYRSDSANKLMKQQGVGTKPSQNTKFGKPTKFNNSYEYGTNNILLEQIKNFKLFETATAVPSLSGGMEAADGYVDKVSETSSPEQLEKASDDANNIAKEGGKGLSDSDLAKIDNKAEADAKKLTNVNINNPGSMDNDQLFSSIDSIYEVDPDWLNKTFDKLEPLIPQSKIDKLQKDYADEETDRETERETIQDQLNQHDENYNEFRGGGWTENGVRYAGSVNWGAQFTKQNFKSSGQSFSEYISVRERLGFFNNNSGPDEDGRYHPGVGPLSILNAKKNGHRPEQFTGVAYEIVSRSYRLEEIRSERNFPQPGQNIYHTKEDYDEAVALEKEYDRIFAEYINFWEGPGGFDELLKEAWAFDDRSRELMEQDARDAKKRRDVLQSRLDNLGSSKGSKGYEDEYYEKLEDLYRPFFIAIINDWNEFNGQGDDINDDPFAIKDYVNQDGSLKNMSEADKKRLKSYLSKMGVSYGDVAYAAAGDGITGGLAELIIGSGIAVIGAIGSLYNMTSTQVQNMYQAATTLDSSDYDNPYTRENDKREAAKRGDAVKKGETREKGTSEAEKQEVSDADQQLQDAEQEAKDAEASGDSDRIDRAYDNYTKARNNRTRVRNKWKTNRTNQKESYEPRFLKNLRNKKESYEPQFLKNRERKNVTEIVTPKQKRILREIKKPVQVKEIPTKFKVKPTGRKNKSVGVDMMNIPDVPKQYKPPTNMWGRHEYKQNVRRSQEKKNEVLELVGAAEHHWTYLTEDRRKKQQEKVNEMMSVEYDKQMELLYEKHRIKESKVNKAISAFKKPTDIKPEYPKDPPPQIDPETGMHPKYGKRYKHDKLDPHSAEFMPPTGDPEIDANIKKATNAKEKARKLKILLGKKA